MRCFSKSRISFPISPQWAMHYLYGGPDLAKSLTDRFREVNKDIS